MTSKTYNIAGIGNIEIHKHHNSKRISINLRPGNLPKVIIPKLMTYDMGFRFAVDKKNWIIQSTEKIKQKYNTAIYDQNNGLKTQQHIISIKTHNKHTIKALKTGGNINIFIPEDQDVHSEESQKAIKNIMIEAFRFEAKQTLIPRINILAKDYGFNYNKVVIKNLKSRWGSCSYQNNINLNLHLVRFPEYLSDFIILHELCHTVHKNHGPQFHALLNEIVGNEKLLNKEVKNYTTQL